MITLLLLQEADVDLSTSSQYISVCSYIYHCMAWIISLQRLSWSCEVRIMSLENKCLEVNYFQRVESPRGFTVSKACKSYLKKMNELYVDFYTWIAVYGDQRCQIFWFRHKQKGDFTDRNLIQTQIIGWYCFQPFYVPDWVWSQFYRVEGWLPRCFLHAKEDPLVTWSLLTGVWGWLSDIAVL